jgi:hypothetical protein
MSSKPLFEAMTGLPTYVGGPQGGFGAIKFPTKSGDVLIPCPHSDEREFYVRQLRLILSVQVKDVVDPVAA